MSELDRLKEQIAYLKSMDILVGIVMLAVVIVFVGIALDAARRK